jgi:hypothetical protein
VPKIHHAECGKHTVCRALPARVKNWMKLNAEHHRDRDTGEVNATTLAEGAAHQFDHDEWLNDSTHEVWDWASEIAGPVNL